MKTRMYLYVKSLSDLGTFMDTIVLNTIIYTTTHSTIWLAISMGAGVVGGLLSSVSSGILADRMDRRKLMIASDLLRALVLILLIPFPSPIVIVLSRFVNGILGSYFQVSFNADIPQMFGEKNLLGINSLISRLTSVAMVSGFLGAGALTDVIGSQAVIAIDAFSFLLSAVVLFKLRWQANTTTILEKSSRKWNQFLDDIREVKGYLWLQPMLLIAFGVSLIDTFGASSHNLGIPLLAAQLDPANTAFVYGMIWGIWGIGNVLATYLLAKNQKVKDHLFATFYVTMIFMSIGFISFLSASTLWVILPFAFFTGFFDACAMTTYATIVQKSANHIRGRVFGVSTLINRLGFGIGFIVAPMLLEVMSLPHMVWVLHGCIITSTIVGIVLSARFSSKNPQVSSQAV